MVGDIGIPCDFCVKIVCDNCGYQEQLVKEANDNEILFADCLDDDKINESINMKGN